MRTLATLSILVVLVGFVGCADVNLDAAGLMGSNEDADSQDNGSAAAATKDEKSSEVEDLQGHYLTVTVDGKQTEKAGMEGSEQLWKVPSADATPEIKFTMDEEHLGAFKQVDVVINPVKDGTVNRSTMFKSDTVAKMKPGEEIELTDLGYFHDGEYEKVGKLPTGDYRISVQVNGEKTWDRQYIMATVE